MTIDAKRGGLRGVWNIVTTPFTAGGTVDHDSLRRLIEVTIAAGVDGVTLLGVAGEAKRLGADERRAVLETAIEAIAGRVPFVVGTSDDGTDVSIAASREAEAAGAHGLLVAPPTFVGAGAVLTEHYRRIGDAVSVPIVLQDFPPVNDVILAPRDMSDLVRDIEQITTIKLEGPPTPQRTAQTIDLLDGQATIVGGLGGLYFLDELRSGAVGTMTGFAYPEILVAIWRAWLAGDVANACDLYYRYLPILVCEGQPGIGLAVRKYVLKRRGLIATDAVRQPGPRLHPRVMEQIENTIEYLDLDGTFSFLQVQ